MRRVVASRDAKQPLQLGGDSDGWDRDLDLDGAGSLVDDPHRAKTLEEAAHFVALGQHQRGEGLDPLLAGAGADHLEQECAEVASLPVVDHRQRDLRDLGPLGTADMVGDAEPLAAAFVERAHRLVVAMVDVG